MIHPDTFVSPTSKGMGLFANRNFQRGEILWIIDDNDIKISLADYLAFDEMQRQKLNIYSYIDFYHRVIIPWDEGKYLTDGHIFFDTVATSCHNSRRSYVKASNS